MQLERAKPCDFFEYQIGRLYARKTAFQDYAEARKWFVLAAEQGNAYAMFALGNLYYYGNGTDVDYKRRLIISIPVQKTVAFMRISGLGICSEKGLAVKRISENRTNGLQK